MLYDWKTEFYASILGTPLQKSLSQLSSLIQDWDGSKIHAHAKKWEKQLDALPKPEETTFSVADTLSVSRQKQSSDKELAHLNSILKQFMPWRKGPFQFFEVFVDTEWRSDWKWNRILPHLSNLQGRRVLDVGCGSGYHLFRMHEQGAQQVVGIDPTVLFFYQFHCIKRFAQSRNIHFLPVGIEEIPATQAFDTVFSMGVFYHRPDPLLFLKQLKHQLVKGGELVLETLVLEGDESTVLMPKDRYAQMRNVYFLPSIPAMILWLEKVGYRNVQVVDDNITSLEEQRSTQWMENHSLADFLNPQDSSITVEGYSAPRRATFIANK
ncbi:tRNA 5-methoxyuridine(34)/uridine 5-oxyacetic acid(34) synthase CmoB [Ningiella sp. W23]|uniref:tRNA 5-methoxyuridine(34)/uridine 5-oxyacetic acid(34) synthase CmoB n=1 Tax=Ningiella sp. W23 TaxID=3023715 RepID=UPI00375711ED